ncbi:hypothetical protein BJ742DRAFT_816118 [Cladochytrium replicatum]|nr:hypothetical protein BJ742DRAFT_816118 [Cladochytrium replicatum]
MYQIFIQDIIEAKEVEISQLETIKEESAQKISSLSEQLDALHQAHEKCGNKDRIIQDQNERNQHLLLVLEDKDTRISTLAQDLEKTKAELTTVLEQNRQSTAQLAKQVECLQARENHLIDENSALEKQLDAKDEIVTSLKRQIEELESDLLEREQKCDAMVMKLTESLQGLTVHQRRGKSTG